MNQSSKKFDPLFTGVMVINAKVIETDIGFEEINPSCKKWYVDGKLHREDGPAVEWEDGTKEWYRDGELHRLDAPAIERPGGTKEWFINGRRHREDGPAIEDSFGFVEWFLNGVSLTGDEFDQWLMKKNLNEKLHFTLEPKPKDKKNKI